MRRSFFLLLLVPNLVLAGEPWRDRFVWVFGWGLQSDQELSEVGRVVTNAAGAGLNGAVVSCGLDLLCRKKPEELRRLDALSAMCASNGLAFIPAVFSVGYGGGTLAHDRNLAEGFPVENAPLLVKGREARLVAGASPMIKNGDFEQHNGDRFSGYGFHDGPGVQSFADTVTVHDGRVAMRMENFRAHPNGNARIMQEIRVTPRRCYRLSLWIKTQGLDTADGFRVSVLAGSRSLTPVDLKVPATGGWKRYTMLFNSASFETLRIYAGVWGGRAGTFWTDDWAIEEIGPINVLKRPGTPVTVRSADGAVTFEEGRDYEPLIDPAYTPYFIDRPAVPLKLTAGSRIKDGDTVRASWYHSLSINDGQVSVCMAEPAVFDIWDHEAKLLAERYRPSAVMLNMDEVRMAGTCGACRGRDLGELVGACVARQVTILRKHLPGVRVFVWSDMFDPNHNAHGDYYLTEGDYTGSWKHLPRDLTIAVWGGAPREKSLRFFAEQGFGMIGACYYDADDLGDVRAWVGMGRGIPQVCGFMYTPWQKKYDLLGGFGALLQAR